MGPGRRGSPVKGLSQSCGPFCGGVARLLPEQQVRVYAPDRSHMSHVVLETLSQGYDLLSLIGVF